MSTLLYTGACVVDDHACIAIHLTDGGRVHHSQSEHIGDAIPLNNAAIIAARRGLECALDLGFTHANHFLDDRVAAAYIERAESRRTLPQVASEHAALRAARARFHHLSVVVVPSAQNVAFDMAREAAYAFSEAQGFPTSAGQFRLVPDEEIMEALYRAVELSSDGKDAHECLIRATTREAAARVLCARILPVVTRFFVPHLAHLE